VGFVQDSNAELHIGLDKNNNTNTTRLYYQLGFGSNWIQSGITGSVMIRPVFKSGKSGVWNVVEEQPRKDLFRVYPVPANNEVNIELLDASRLTGGCEALVFDMNGRLAHRERVFSGRARIDLSMLPEGMYVLHCISDNGETLHHQKIVKQRR
jgi:hypothetical protein